MKGIQLKLKGEWIALPKDFSLKLEQTNPLFNEDGAFSFPFEVPIEPNRHLFKNIADPFGDIRLKDIDGMEAELWFDGIMIYKGIIETDEEIEFENFIPMTFLSGNGDFMSKINGLNAKDVLLDREIRLGTLVTTAHGSAPSGPITIGHHAFLPESIMMGYDNVNIVDQYPIKTYCNVRVCTSNELGKYKTLEAKRPFSGICFYVLYFLDCLFKQLNIVVGKNELLSVEDMSRLAFFTTKCKYTLSEQEKDIPFSYIKQNFGEDFELTYRLLAGRGDTINTNQFKFKGKDVYASNENFPDVSIVDIINDLKNAFGAKILYDAKQNVVELFFLKDVFRSTDIVNLTINVLNVGLSKKKNESILLTYGVDNNDSFNYSDYSETKTKDYFEILQEGIAPYNRTCYIDPKIGNAYRIKVNKETGGNPSLFEVGGFGDYYSNKKEIENIETIKINYSPVIINDTNGITKITDEEERNQILAVFADVELNSSFQFSGRIFDNRNNAGGDLEYTYMKANFPENYDFNSNDISPLQEYDAGYTLGIMRGPGSTSKVEYVENYDGEGNSSWVQVVANYAFTSDSCDNYGRFFDYNGTESGGADQTGRFSLKLVAGKDGFPIESQYANRGLVSKFLSEYLYFLENRKTVMLEVEMSITQLINIDFLKRYKIGDFVGFINKVSYNMTVNGMEDVVIEMYTL